MLCKMYYFSLVASGLEIFLRGYQSSEQLVPVLHQDMLDIFCVLMSQFLNWVILVATVTPKKILNVNVMDEKNW